MSMFKSKPITDKQRNHRDAEYEAPIIDAGPRAGNNQTPEQAVATTHRPSAEDELRAAAPEVLKGKLKWLGN